MQNTVYEGTLPADTPGKADKAGKAKHAAAHGIPTVAEIQSHITKLMKNVDVGGVATSDPGDVAGRPAYSVVGVAQALRRAAGPRPAGLGCRHRRPAADRHLRPRQRHPRAGAQPPPTSPTGRSPTQTSTSSRPSGDKVVKVSSAGMHGAAAADRRGRPGPRPSTPRSAAWPPWPAHVPFTLAAPKALAGLPREGVTLLDWGGKPAALVTYGQGLGGIAVIEQSGVLAGGGAEQLGLRPRRASTSRRCRSTAPRARSSPPRWERWCASPTAAWPTRCSARWPPTRRRPRRGR